MALANYKQLALSWQPSQKEDRLFAIFAVAAVVVAMLVGGLISSIQVPEKSRSERSAVPERVAKFINLKEKPKPPPPPPKVKPPEPPKPVEPKPEQPKPETAQPRIERERPKPREPLTTEQQQAREKASQSGLLAHMNELNDLMDTPEVAAQVKTDIRQQAGNGSQATGPDTSVLTANANRGSGGVDASRYAARAGDSQLGAADVADHLVARHVGGDRGEIEREEHAVGALRRSGRAGVEPLVAIGRQRLDFADRGLHLVDDCLALRDRLGSCLGRTSAGDGQCFAPFRDSGPNLRRHGGSRLAGAKALAAASLNGEALVHAAAPCFQRWRKVRSPCVMTSRSGKRSLRAPCTKRRRTSSRQGA